MSKKFVVEFEEVSINLPKKATATTPPDDPVMWLSPFGLYLFLEEYRKTVFVDQRKS